MNFVPPTRLDDLDRVLIEYLLQDGKMTNRELAAHIGISESAVSIRLRKLAANGAIIFTALIDWEVAGFEWFVIARIKTQARSPRDVAEDVSRLEQCEAVAVTLGTHDVLAYFLVKDRAELRQLTNDDLPAISGISEMSVDLATETSVTPNGRRLFLANSGARSVTGPTGRPGRRWPWPRPSPGSGSAMLVCISRTPTPTRSLGECATSTPMATRATNR